MTRDELGFIGRIFLCLWVIDIFDFFSLLFDWIKRKCSSFSAPHSVINWEMRSLCKWNEIEFHTSLRAWLWFVGWKKEKFLSGRRKFFCRKIFISVDRITKESTQHWKISRLSSRSKDSKLRTTHIFEFEFHKKTSASPTVLSFRIDSFSFHFYSLQNTQKFPFVDSLYGKVCASMSTGDGKIFGKFSPPFYTLRKKRSSSSSCVQWKSWYCLWISIVENFIWFSLPQVKPLNAFRVWNVCMCMWLWNFGCVQAFQLTRRKFLGNCRIRKDFPDF